MSWYKTGTIAVTNGSAVIAGTGTAWVSNAAAGEAIYCPDGKFYEIESVNGDTSITLAGNYTGTSLSGQGYTILPSQSFIRDLAAQAAALINNYASIASAAGAGKFGDGALGAPGVTFVNDTDTGIRRTASGTFRLVANGVDIAEIGPNGLTPVTALILPGATNPAQTAEGSVVWDTDSDLLTVGDGASRKTMADTTSTQTLTNKTITQPTLTLKQSAAPTPTAEGDIQWDTDDNKIKVGDGAATKTFSDDSVTGGIHGVSGNFVGTSDVQTMTNKTISGGTVAPDSASLAAIDTAFLASTTLVDVCLYDTAKDSDGGAWRKRCGHTSWENEQLSGNWLGSAANEAAARAISGATTGSYYYDTTAAVFYKINAGSGVTQVYRGNARQFPARVLITVENLRVVIWDLTQAGCPMWMVFVCGTNNILHTTNYTRSCAAMINGILVIGAASTYGIAHISFLSEAVIAIWKSATYYRNQYAGNIASRNGAAGLISLADSASYQLVSGTVNDVAITVLPNAPIDVATGLPVPTIAVATDGGASVITDSGGVWDITGYTPVTRVGFFGSALLMSSSFSTDNATIGPAVLTADIAQTSWRYGGGQYDISSTPATISDSSRLSVAGIKDFSLAGTNGLSRVVPSFSTQAYGMVAAITKDYNSGWQPGAIKGAWLADTVAETLTGAELVTNGDFPTATTGWTAQQSALAVVSAELQITNSGAVYGVATQAITTVAGKTYVVSCSARKGTAASATLAVGTSAGANQLGSVATSSATNVILQVTFVATGTTSYVSVYNNNDNNGTGYYDNITCRLADVDRSVKAKGLQAFGSLTKAAVASGAQLVGYSGFSASNYLEQPYNADLDFGTGDFFVMGWLKEAPNVANETVFCRATLGSYSGSGIHCYVDSSGTLKALVSDDAFATSDTITSSSVIDDSTWKLAALIRRGSYFELWINSSKAASDVAVTNANTSLSNTSAVMEYGRNTINTLALTNGTLALWRTGAYAPTADQIKHIYETEKALFEPNAQCCLAGSSNAVTALAYDDETDLLHVGTSYGRSAFKGLVRVASEATPVGSLVALAAGGGIVAQAGATGADVYVPAYNLREELNREAEQAAAFGAALVAHDFDATASQTTFTLPVGWEIVAVYAQGSIKREGAAKDWARSFDGFKWSVVFAAGRSASDWISILAKRV